MNKVLSDTQIKTFHRRGWWLYILYSKEGNEWYTGVTVDFDRRFRSHSRGGSKLTRHRSDWKPIIVYDFRQLAYYDVAKIESFIRKHYTYQVDSFYKDDVLGVLGSDSIISDLLTRPDTRFQAALRSYEKDNPIDCLKIFELR